MKNDDLIKRSDAIKAVSKVDDYGDGIGFEVRSHCLVELELVPSADRPQGEWIPCSERLPEYRKLLLVTTRDLRVKPAYLDSIQDDGTDDWWSIPLDDADCASWNIVAWMPLPKPWKGEDDD